MKALKVLKYVGFALLGLAFIFLAILVTMSLWNWLVPELFKGPELTFWQTAGLFLLSKILLTGVAPGRSHHRSGKYWHHKYHAKYRCWPEERMTNEEEQVSAKEV